MKVFRVAISTNVILRKVIVTKLMFTKLIFTKEFVNFWTRLQVFLVRSVEWIQIIILRFEVKHAETVDKVYSS